MRRRVLGLVFATTLLAVTLLGTLIVVTIWAVMGNAIQTRAAATARVASGAFEDTLEIGATPTQAQLEGLVRDNATLVATLPDGTVISAGDPVDPADSFVASSTDRGVTVVASIPKSVVRAQVLGQSAVVLGISLLVLAISMTVAWFYTRRLLRPLEDFAEQAALLASGDARSLGRRYGVPEIDAVAEVLDFGVVGFNGLLEKERRVTSEVSHQLRTPLTALSLRLDEVLAAGSLEEARAEATAALGQVERLAGVIDEVAAVNRGLVGPVSVYSIDELVDAQRSEWLPAYQAEGRPLVVEGRVGAEAEGVRGMQAQVLATLLENSLQHGGGTTTVRVRRSGSWSVVEVCDEGPGVPPGIEGTVFERNVSGAESTGLGLALARTLITADGGRLELLSARPAVFAMFLPTHAAAAPETVGAAPNEESDVPAVEPEAQTEVWMAASSAASASSGNTQRR